MAPTGLRQVLTLVMGPVSPVTSPSIPIFKALHAYAPSPETRIVMQLPRAQLSASGIASGTTLHLAAYPGDSDLLFRYNHAEQKYFPSGVTTPSNEVSVTIP